jgi:uncharacterized damage-inducible protein DinB
MTTLAACLGAMMARELTTLKKELEAYPSDADVWRIAPGITNSAGTLALHLAGNLRHFIGAVLGGTGYRRDRDREFAARDLPRTELFAGIDEAIAAVEATLGRLPDAELAKEYPEPVAKVRVETGDFLVHLVSHLSYHLGQVDYHRRLVTGSAGTVGAVAPGRLRSARPAE